MKVAAYTKGNGIEIGSMGKVNVHFLTGIYTLDNGEKIRCMELENLLMLMEIFTKENGLKVRRMVKENQLTSMDKLLKDNGLMDLLKRAVKSVIKFNLLNEFFFYHQCYGQCLGL